MRRWSCYTTSAESALVSNLSGALKNMTRLVSSKLKHCVYMCLWRVSRGSWWKGVCVCICLFFNLWHKQSTGHEQALIFSRPASSPDVIPGIFNYSSACLRTFMKCCCATFSWRERREGAWNMQKFQFANWLVTISIVQRSERDPLGERDCERWDDF